MSRIRADQLVNRAGSGGPKFPHGVAEGFSVSGVVTATSYRGDGSQLTGIDASSLKDGSDVKVQATATGATVTGTLVADVSGNVTGNVTSSGANTLGSLTVSNDATVQGNLTVNGTTTTIDTAITAVDSLAVDGQVTALGRLGIGTANPQLKFVVSNNGALGFEVDPSQSSGTVCGVNAYDRNASAFKPLRLNAEEHRFDTSSTERLRITSAGHVEPSADNTYDLGGAGNRWRNIYTGDLNLSNEGSANDVDGTWGQYTIQEGENDLFLINKRTGKKYKFNLTEVD